MGKTSGKPLIDGAASRLAFGAAQKLSEMHNNPTNFRVFCAKPVRYWGDKQTSGKLAQIDVNDQSGLRPAVHVAVAKPVSAPTKVSV
jgi:hypothetical protein